MAENGSVPISDGSEQNGAGSGPAAEPQREPPPRQPRAEREEAFTFSAWLLEGMAGLCEELQHNDLGLPPDFWTHAYAARREGLLACRALIDAALARCEADAARRKEKPGGQRGRVEID
ncbi:MAG: hypothetical protein OXF50_18280 [Caldilineaceae bacterium]|nr:hypothetical protein [Caldilineaceae bacterium]